MKKIIFPVLVVLFTLSSCDKEDHDDHDHDHVPEITINEPGGDHYHSGDTVIIDVIATDAHEMHEVGAWLIAVPQNDTLWKDKVHSHAGSVELKSSYILGHLPDDQKIDFIVLAENEEGRTSTAKHSFEVHDH